MGSLGCFVRRCCLLKRFEVGKHTGEPTRSHTKQGWLIVFSTAVLDCGCATLWLAEGLASDDLSLLWKVNLWGFLGKVWDSRLWRSNRGGQMSKTRHLTLVFSGTVMEDEEVCGRVMGCLGVCLLGTPRLERVPFSVLKIWSVR